MNQWLLFSNHPNNKLHASDSAARRCSGQRLNLAVADAAEPVFPAAPLLTEGADAGAEPWYKTIAKLMQGRNRTFHTHNANPRAGALRMERISGVTRISSYLVDPASSHMLVLKIKPCMSKYKHLYRETANGSLKQLWFI